MLFNVVCMLLQVQKIKYYYLTVIYIEDLIIYLSLPTNWRTYTNWYDRVLSSNILLKISKEEHTLNYLAPSSWFIGYSRELCLGSTKGRRCYVVVDIT